MMTRFGGRWTDNPVLQFLNLNFQQLAFSYLKNGDKTILYITWPD